MQPIAEEERRQAIEAECREEGEGEHDAAELGENAGGRDHDLAQQSVRIAADDGPREQPADDRAPDGGGNGELDGPDECVDEDAVGEEPGDVVERDGARRRS